MTQHSFRASPVSIDTDTTRISKNADRQTDGQMAFQLYNYSRYTLYSSFRGKIFMIFTNAIHENFTLEIFTLHINKMVLFKYFKVDKCVKGANYHIIFNHCYSVVVLSCSQGSIVHNCSGPYILVNMISPHNGLYFKRLRAILASAIIIIKYYNSVARHKNI